MTEFPGFAACGIDTNLPFTVEVHVKQGDKVVVVKNGFICDEALETLLEMQSRQFKQSMGENHGG